MEKKYVVRGKVEGKQAVLHIMLTVSPAPAPQSSHYRLEVRARGHFGVKNERMLFLLLKGQQWQRREEKEVWRVRNVAQKRWWN